MRMLYDPKESVLSFKHIPLLPIKKSGDVEIELTLKTRFSKAYIRKMRSSGENVLVQNTTGYRV